VSDEALISQRLLGVEEIFGTAIPNSPEFVAAFERCYGSLRDNGVTETLQNLLKKPV
jgi:mannitol 2-dehydrogenase